MQTTVIRGVRKIERKEGRTDTGLSGVGGTIVAIFFALSGLGLLLSAWPNSRSQ